MSPDLIAFDLDAAPTHREDFIAWYRDAARRVGPVDRAVMTPELIGFYDAMRATFPSMSGPDATPVDAPRGLIDRLLFRKAVPADPSCLAEYGFSGAAVHVRFARQMVRTAMASGLVAAKELGLGVFDARTQGGAILRDPYEIDDMLVLLAA